jgi:hypothetical protein
MGLFGIDANSATSTLTNAQVTSQYGAAYGSGIGKGAIGGGTSGLIFTGKVGKGATVNITVPPSPSPMAELQSNQSMSSQHFDISGFSELLTNAISTPAEQPMYQGAPQQIISEPSEPPAPSLSMPAKVGLGIAAVLLVVLVIKKLK